MPSPVLNRKKEGGNFTITLAAKRAFQAVFKNQNKKDPYDESIPRIAVSELISKMAFYYEKIRNAVDYKEEYLLRKDAIFRILKRKLIIEGAIKNAINDKTEILNTAKHLVVELIRAGYLPNNDLPEAIIADLAVVIEKYVYLRQGTVANIASEKIISRKQKKAELRKIEEVSEMTNWIIGIMSSEIEDFFSDSQYIQESVNNIFDVIRKNVALPNDLPYDNDLDIQIYLAIYRKFLKFDDVDVLSYILFKYFNNNWTKATETEVTMAIDNIFEIKKKTDFQLEHPLKNQIDKVASIYAVYFSVLIDVIEKDPVRVYEELKTDTKLFNSYIKKACEKKYKSNKSKLWRSAIRSIIYIFLTKSVLVFILEIPATQFFNEPINYAALAINVSFPALLLFLAVFFTALPGEANTQKIVKGIGEIIFEENKRLKPILLRRPVKRGGIIGYVFGFIYGTTFILSFGFIIWVLTKSGFNWVSTIIFLFFLAFVSFFIVRIKRGPKELMIIEPRENIFKFLSSFIYMPIVATGKWLSGKFSRMNIFVFILDFIIEAPFKVVVEIAEEWTKYTKERKDEIS